MVNTTIMTNATQSGFIGGAMGILNPAVDFVEFLVIKFTRIVAWILLVLVLFLALRFLFRMLWPG